MLEAMQKMLPNVCWGELKVDNCWLFEYLGSLFQPDGEQMTDVRRRCAMAKTRAGSLRHIWASDLSEDLKMRLYITACCSILVYGSEAWLLNDNARRCINGTNAYMLSHITGKTKREEATAATTTFNIMAWIRARRLKWVGHILRLCDSDKRLIKETLKVIFDNRQEGDILMDVDADLTWDQLQKQARDRDAWRKKVHVLKKDVGRTTAPTGEDNSKCNNERKDEVHVCDNKACANQGEEQEEENE